MLRRNHTIAGLALWLAIPIALPAQSLNDAAAYFALSLTPAGALPPVPFVSGELGRQSALALRYGNLSMEGQTIRHFAVGYQFPAGASQASLTLGSSTCDDCERTIMVGIDWRVPINSGPVKVALHPGVGVTRFLEGVDVTAFSAAVTVPVSIPMALNGGAQLIQFIDPGYGYGRLAADGETSMGEARPMLGGGIMLAGLGGRTSIHGAAQKVFIEGGDVTFGVGISIAGGRR